MRLDHPTGQDSRTRRDRRDRRYRKGQFGVLVPGRAAHLPSDVMARLTQALLVSSLALAP
jgi:hypothetical protein